MELVSSLTDNNMQIYNENQILSGNPSGNRLSIEEKLKILTDAAKYDVACTSSGVNRAGNGKSLGSAVGCGICHAFASDGRCVSLLKILYTNECIFDCKYCINRSSNDVPRATFTPDEVCALTMQFYRRNYIEGLFLSSGVFRSPNYTMELIYETISKLRTEHGFNGYIHVKGIPGVDPAIIERLGLLVDRMSVNLELPTGEGLRKLAPHKNRKSILTPIRQIQRGIAQNKNELTVYKKTPKFVPAGQSTQMIIGASPENDYQIMTVAEALYDNYNLKRVFYSAYVDVNKNMPLLGGDVGLANMKHTLFDNPMNTMTGPPLLREHRLYQADWLLRFYGFKANELLSEDKPNFNVLLDPKCEWAIRHLEMFPIEINKADYFTLLRIPGLGTTSAKRIVAARQHTALDFDDLKKIGVVLKRALYFITCSGKMMYNTRIEEDYITNHIVYNDKPAKLGMQETITYKQLSLFDDAKFNIVPNSGEGVSALYGQL